MFGPEDSVRPDHEFIPKLREVSYKPNIYNSGNDYHPKPTMSMMSPFSHPAGSASPPALARHYSSSSTSGTAFHRRGRSLCHIPRRCLAGSAAETSSEGGQQPSPARPSSPSLHLRALRPAPTPTFTPPPAPRQRRRRPGGAGRPKRDRVKPACCGVQGRGAGRRSAT